MWIPGEPTFYISSDFLGNDFTLQLYNKFGYFIGCVKSVFHDVNVFNCIVQLYFKQDHSKMCVKFLWF